MAPARPARGAPLLPPLSLPGRGAASAPSAVRGRMPRAFLARSAHHDADRLALPEEVTPPNYPAPR